MRDRQIPLKGMARLIETEHDRLIRRVAEEAETLDTVEDFDRLALALAELFDETGHAYAAARMRRVDVFAKIRAQVEAAHTKAHEEALKEAEEAARQSALADAADRVSEHLEVARKALVAAADSIEDETEDDSDSDG